MPLYFYVPLSFLAHFWVLTWVFPNADHFLLLFARSGPTWNRTMHEESEAVFPEGPVMVSWEGLHVGSPNGLPVLSSEALHHLIVPLPPWLLSMSFVSYIVWFSGMYSHQKYILLLNKRMYTSSLSTLHPLNLFQKY